ncbi:MAG: DUF3822 family protein [Prolixibacteraceae bacterium]|nr:DUF3822 family protein [Prolixibacteraceae bacterium]
MPGLIVDNAFDHKKIKEYNLSIEVSLGGFSFTVTGEKENRLLAFKHSQLKISNVRFMARRLTEWIDSEKILRQYFKQTRVVVNSDQFTLLPNNFSETEQKFRLENIIVPPGQNNSLEKNFVEAFNLQILFALPPHLKSSLPTNLNNATFVHPLQLILSNFPEVKKEAGVVVYFNSDKFYLAIVENTKLLLANIFRIAHPNDTIYYLLSSLKQLEILPRQIDLFLVGEIPREKETNQLLINYFDVFQHLKSKSMNIDFTIFNESVCHFISNIW